LAFLSAPMSAYLLAKAALHLGVTPGTALPRKRAGGPGWSNGEGRPELPVAQADGAAPHSQAHGSS
jgi:hypothetical protein